MITSKKLLKIKNISHGFFNRNGGKSKVFIKVLNCGPGSNDINKIEKKFKIVKKKLVKKQKIFSYFIKFIVINLYL